MKEKDLAVYDLWESPNGNLFIKVDDNYSLGIGTKGHHAVSQDFGDLNHTQYVRANDITEVKKVGRLIFNDDKLETIMEILNVIKSQQV